MDLFSEIGQEDQGGKPRAKVYSVAEITHQIKFLLEESFPILLVQGEISNLNMHSSGHIYFTLKDEQAQMRCVVWRSQAENLRFAPEEGMKILVRGRLALYERGGYYQIVVQQIQPQGLGELQLAFERLKRKLLGEGLFDETRKKPLPEHPQVVGVVTSPTGAAIRDIISVIRRRMPSMPIVLMPVRVQGEGAAVEIASAIRTMDDWGVDVLIVGRGGGSLEDLWAFNEEAVARAIFECHTPVVSAVGHEVDFTIADFVADVRAATPSAAAELVTPDKADMEQRLRHLRHLLIRNLQNRLSAWRQAVTRLESHYALRQPENAVAQYRQRTDELDRRLSKSVLQTVSLSAQKLDALERNLQLLSPHHTLRRGYAMVRRGQTVIQNASQLKDHDRAIVEFHDGTVPVEVLPS